MNEINVRDFLDKYIIKRTKIGGTVTIEVPEELYYMEMALYTGVSLIGNAISKCEIKTYKNGVEIKEEDYFTLNYSPNVNENAAKFWHKVINKMIRERRALVVEINGKLFCADDWGVKEENVLYGNIYENVRVDNFVFGKTFSAREVYLFEMDNEDIGAIITGVYSSFGKVLSSALKSYRRGKGQKLKLILDETKAGDEEFNSLFKEYLEEDLKKFMESENALYPEYKGYELRRMDKEENVATAEDVISIKNDLFDSVGKALKIPQSLMEGNVNNTKEVVKAFLTFGVDPIADMISETLTKRGGYQNFAKGNYYKVCTNKINHIDLFDIAQGMEKLIASGGFSIDEVRKEADYQEKGEEWSKIHWMTKNYETIEEMLKEIMKGGTSSE